MELDEGCEIIQKRNDYCHKCDANRDNKDWCGYVLDCNHRPLFDRFVAKEKMENIYNIINNSIKNLKDKR